MSRNSKKREETEKNDKEITIAKISYRNTIIVAILGLVGTAITAYFGYLSSRTKEFEQEILPTQKISPSSITVTLTPLPTPNPPATQTIEIASKLLRDPSTGYIVIYPSCNCSYDLEELQEFEPLIVRLRWGAKSADLAEKGADSISYSLFINGELVSDLEQYRKPAIFVQDPILGQDNPDSWWVYWDYLILEPKRQIDVMGRIITNEEVDNGWNIIPANYEDTFTSTIDLISLFQID